MNVKAAIQALCDANVEFVIIGGWSAIFQGSVYSTNDLDICYSRSSENLKRLVGAIAPFNPQLRDFPPGLPFLWDETTRQNGTVFTLNTDLGPIDLLAEVSGLGSFQEVKERSIPVTAFERRVLSLDLVGLIESKRAAGRPKDLMHLKELESLLEAQGGDVET